MIQPELFSQDSGSGDGLKPGYIWTGNKGEQRRISSADGQKAIRMKKCERYEKKILMYRGQGKSTKEIANIIGVPNGTMRAFVGRFGKDDPFKLKVVEMFKNGDSTKYIAKKLKVSKTTVTYALRDHGIDPWDTYLKKASPAYKKKGVTGRREKAEAIAKRKARTEERRKAISEDIYCFVYGGMSLEKTARATGYNPAYLSEMLNKYVPKYSKESKARRDRASGREVSFNKRSPRYRYESDFSAVVAKTLMEHGDIEAGCVGLSKMEIDILFKRNNTAYVIELKVSTRMVDIARAVGQTLINAKTIDADERVVPVICVPSDLEWTNDVNNECEEMGILTCNEKNLLKVFGIDG